MNTADQKAVIYEIQNYLRELYKNNIISQQITPTGVYDRQTVDAIKEFQRTAGLPQTGITDYPTWVILSDAARQLQGFDDASNPIYPFNMMRNGASVSFGERSDLVYIIQIMLKNLIRYDFEDLMITGSYDRATLEAVRRFQRMNRIEETGSVNRTTWDLLANAYNLSLFEPN